MGGNPATDVNADGRNLGLSHPDSGHSLATAASNSKFPDRADHPFFQYSHIPDPVLANSSQVQDRVTDNLSWPVEGNAPPTICLDQINPLPAQLLRAA